MTEQTRILTAVAVARRHYPALVGLMELYVVWLGVTANSRIVTFIGGIGLFMAIVLEAEILLRK